MNAISIDSGDLYTRASRFPVRLAVAIGETADTARPWGIASDVSASGMYVRTLRTPARGKLVRLWFVDGGELRPLDAHVARGGTGGVAVRFDDPSFYRWAFERTTTY